MVRCGFYSLLQYVVCGALMLGALMPYVQYLMFSQALSVGLAPPAASALSDPSTRGIGPGPSSARVGLASIHS
jgi:hypothetical protein